MTAKRRTGEPACADHGPTPHPSRFEGVFIEGTSASSGTRTTYGVPTYPPLNETLRQTADPAPSPPPQPKVKKTKAKNKRTAVKAKAITLFKRYRRKMTDLAATKKVNEELDTDYPTSTLRTYVYASNREKSGD